MHSETTPIKNEELLIDGDAYFASLAKGIEQAQATIDLESYIFGNDKVGLRIIELLIAARKRGVAIRVIVDGVGSMGFASSLAPVLQNAEIPYKIYHQLPWERFFNKNPQAGGPKSLVQLFTHINKRDHRKLCVIDQNKVWLGSVNISAVHSREVSGDKAWHDISIRFEGDDARFLIAAFDYIWVPSIRRLQKSRKPTRTRIASSYNSAIRLNSLRKLRRQNYSVLLSKLKCATNRIWIMNAYFAPAKSFLNALSNASKRGVDVKVIVPSTSDIFFMPWLSAVFEYTLLRVGVKVYEFLPTILHAKVMLIDDEIIVGSSNLNHRSLIHDLEVDIRSKNKTVVDQLTAQFLTDLANSRERTLTDFGNFPFWKRTLASIALKLRYWL